MTFAPTFALAVPAAALVALIALGVVPRARPYTRFLVPAVAMLSLLGVLAARLEPAESVLLARWSPEVLFGVSPLLRADPLTWPLAVGLAVAVTGAGLAQLARRARSPFTLEMAALGVLVAGLGSLWGDNPLTVLLFWGVFDLMWALGTAAGGGRARRLAWGVSAGLVATAVLWAGTVAIGTKGSLASWDLVSLSDPGRTLLLVACVLRLSLYPVHLALSPEAVVGVPVAAPLLLGPVLGWGLLLRVMSAAEGGVMVDAPWMLWAGLAALVAGAVLAWARSRPQEVLPWAAMAANGALVWGVAAGGEAAVAAAGAAAWVMGTTLVALGRGWERKAPWWGLPSLLGGLALLGVPPNLSRGALAAVLLDLSSPLDVGKGLLFLVGEGLLVAALARRVLRPAVWEGRAEPLEVAARAAGEGLPAAFLLVGGLVPTLLVPASGLLSWRALFSAATLWGWGGWLLAWVGGGALYWMEGRFRDRLTAPLALLSDVIGLEWAYDLLLGGLGRASRFFQAMAELIEGAGAVFWALALFLLILLFLIQR